MIGDLANNRTDMAVQQITDNDKRRQESRSSSGISLHIEKWAETFVILIWYVYVSIDQEDIVFTSRSDGRSVSLPAPS